jgi:hypothetical protein
MAFETSANGRFIRKTAFPLRFHPGHHDSHANTHSSQKSYPVPTNTRVIDIAGLRGLAELHR